MTVNGDDDDDDDYYYYFLFFLSFSTRDILGLVSISAAAITECKE